jgi:hypothetical protein
MVNALRDQAVSDLRWSEVAVTVPSGAEETKSATDYSSTLSK